MRYKVVRRAMVVAGAVAVVLGTGAGVAAAAQMPVLGWTPPGPVFGTLAPGGTASQAFTLKNTGGAASSQLTITVTPSSAYAIKPGTDTCTGKSLAPGKSCTVTVIFTAPATPGSYPGTLTATGFKPNVTATVHLAGVSQSPKVTPVITTAQQPATGTAGVKIGDQATVTGPAGDSPTGTVTFSLYDNPNCNNPLLTQSEPLTSGVATIGGILATGPGTAYWVASYGGDASNNPVTTGCSDEPVTITQAQPAISTAQQPAAAAVGTAIADQATVTGGFEPNGTVTFTLYSSPDCTGTLFTDTEQLPFDGNSVTSASYTATTTGTDYWVASYNGDLANLTATSSCGGEPVTVSTCLVTDTTSGQTFTDLPDAVAAAASGDTLTVEGTCTGTTTIGNNLTLTITGVRGGGTRTGTLDGNQQGTVLTIDPGATVTLNTLDITGGSAGTTLAGGILNGATLTVNNSIITGNTGAAGGGIFNAGNGTLTLNGSTVSGNTGTGVGGGIANNIGGTVTLNDSTVTGNTTTSPSGTADGGGGIDNDNGTVTLNGTSSVTGNTTGGTGGGIFTVGGTVTMNDSSTVTGNTGYQGGGIFNGCGTVTLNGNAAVTGNTATSGTGNDLFTPSICGLP